MPGDLEILKSAILFLNFFLINLKNDWIIYAVACTFFCVGTLYLIGSSHTVAGMLAHYAVQWSLNFGLFGPFFAFTAGVIHIAWRMKGRKRLAYRTMISPKRLARFAAGTFFLLTGGLLFTSTFSAIKTSFPNGGGFQHDRVHADIDRVLHFGVDPFRYLYSFAQHSWLLRIVETNYGVVWFLVCYFTLYFVMTSSRTDAIRVRFGLTWLGSWMIVGIWMAGQWLSAGPVYYGFVTGDVSRFADQLSFLATSANTKGSAYDFQQYLWFLHESNQQGLGSGISAFPSMHVALITVVALFVSERSRAFGALAWIYVGFIVLSSVYLGWHYAIDGYAAVVSVVVLYWGLRWIMPAETHWRWRASGGEQGGNKALA